MLRSQKRTCFDNDVHKNGGNSGRVAVICGLGQKKGLFSGSCAQIDGVVQKLRGFSGSWMIFRGIGLNMIKNCPQSSLVYFLRTVFICCSACCTISCCLLSFYLLGLSIWCLLPINQTSWLEFVDKCELVWKIPGFCLRLVFK